MESLNDALKQVVDALGGAKKIAPVLWPEKSVQAAHTLLLDCFNPDRPAHLSLDHAVMIMRMGHAAGNHCAVAWLLEHLSYAPTTPKTPRDEAAELQRQFIEMGKMMAGMSERILTLQAAASAGQHDQAHPLLSEMHAPYIGGVRSMRAVA